MSYDPREGASPYLGMEPEGGDAPADDSLEIDWDYHEEDDLLDEDPDSSYGGLFSHEESSPAQSNPYVGLDPAETMLTGAGGEAVSQAQSVPATTYRPAGGPRRGVAQAPRADAMDATQADVKRDRRPLRRPARQEQEPVRPAPVPSPQQTPYVSGDTYGDVALPDAPTLPRPLAWLMALALFALALFLRACAIGLSALVVLCAILTDARRAALVTVLNQVSSLIPSALLGRLVYETPFGGALRGDFIIAALVLFVADWLCLRLAASLRDGRR